MAKPHSLLPVLLATSVLLLVTPAPAQVGHHYDRILDTSGPRRSLRILEKAIRKASTIDNPERSYIRIAETAIAVKKAGDVCRLLDQMAGQMEKWEVEDGVWPESTVNAFAVFAESVAPFCRYRRDAFLARALKRSEQQLPDENCVPKMLELEKELWRAVLLSTRHRDQAIPKLQALLVRANAAGPTHGCLDYSYRDRILDKLARLDPELMLKVWPAEDKDKLPKHCFQLARQLHRFTYRGRNHVSDVLLGYAAKHGEPSEECLELHELYSVDKALARRRIGQVFRVPPAAFSNYASPRRSTKERLACSPEEKKRRIQRLVEVVETSEDDTLYEVQCLLVYDKALGLKMMKPNRYHSSRQAFLGRVIYDMGYWGDHDLAEELLEEITYPPHYVSVACDLAKHAVEQRYVMSGMETFDYPRFWKAMENEAGGGDVNHGDVKR